jgi:mono/diheme cytochrome c family protein
MTLARPSSRALAAVAAFAALALVTGCDLQENADLDKGRMLFQQNCGTCHTLAEAGTSADIGPDLDAAFAQARHDGQDPDTFEGVVSAQIANPRPTSPEDTDTFMPADLVKGEDADAVASYVASVAGIPGIKPPKLPPPQLFAEQCGICHTLAAAGSTATTGPDLDQALPGMSPAEIEQSIVEPDAKIAPGFGPGIMPSTFATTLTPDDIKGLVTYLTQSAGGGAK